MKIQNTPEEGMGSAKVLQVDELDLHIIEDEPHMAPMEKLENFEVGSPTSPKFLQVNKSLPLALKEKLQNFLRSNLDVFA